MVLLIVKVEKGSYRFHRNPSSSTDIVVCFWGSEPAILVHATEVNVCAFLQKGWTLYLNITYVQVLR
jgi:hypothetical protein